MDETPTQPLLGGRYRLLRDLGQGGMSQVHVARDEVLGRDVAVKVVHGGRVADPADVERLEREARAVAGLSHPNVVVVHDVLRDAGGAAIVMELVEGGTLADRIRERAPMSWRDAASLAADVAAGLAAAHAVGLVHRDVKPSNVLVGADGRVKVADFGIAGLADASTHTTTVRGSIPYLAPEQARGGRPDPRTDVYALGCVLYEMLTGRPPFADDHGAAIIGQHLHRAPTPPGQHVSGLPAGLDHLVLQMLAKEPDDRPADMGTVRDALTGLLEGRGLAATTAVLGGVGTASPVAAEGSSAAEATEVITVEQGSGRTPAGRRLAAGAGVAAVLVVAVLAGWALRGVGGPTAGDAAPVVGASEPTTPEATSSPAPAEPTSEAAEPTAPPDSVPSEPASPESASSDPAPTERPTDVPEAAEAFRRLLVAGRSDGMASAKAVEELDKLVTEIVAKGREDKAQDVRDGARKLDEKVEEYVEKGELTESLGDDLQDAAREFRRLSNEGGGPDE